MVTAHRGPRRAAVERPSGAGVGVPHVAGGHSSEFPLSISQQKELVMPDKSPQKPSAKKPGKSLKEKRADKKVKHQAGKRLMDS